MLNALEKAPLAAGGLEAATDGCMAVYSHSHSDEPATLGVKQSAGAQDSPCSVIFVHHLGGSAQK